MNLRPATAGREFKSWATSPDKRDMKHATLKHLVGTKFSRIRIPLTVLLIFFISSCAGAPPQNKTTTMTPKAISSPHPLPGKKSTSPTIEQRLRGEVRLWEGTPHRMGGTRRSGVDCSGFVQRIFIDLFNVNLPRSTAQQVHSGKPVAVDHLRPGDLVFFHPPHKVRHVGVYLGGGEFAHASTSRGVTISRMDSAYWRNAYWTARRIPSVPG